MSIIRILILTVLIMIVSSGCVVPNPYVPQPRTATLRVTESEPEKLQLWISRREWVGIWGPEGWVGYRNAGFWIVLYGKGPVFTDLEVEDSKYRCVGKVTLNLGQKQAVLDIQRIVSKPGEPLRTKKHPANGTYNIKSIEPFPPG